MYSYVVHVYDKCKTLIKPLSKDYQLAVGCINYYYKPTSKNSHRFFNLACNNISHSPVSQDILRSIIIPAGSSAAQPIYTEFTSLEYHQLAGTTTRLLFEWPEDIEVLNFTIHCRHNVKQR